MVAHLQAAATVIIIAAAIPATLFPPLYAWVGRGVWWRVPAGRALLVSSIALALLLDLSLVLRVVQPSPLVGAILTVVVVSLISAGAYLKMGALIFEARRGRRSPLRKS